MKYVSVLLCLVLLLGTAIFLPSATDKEIIAGPDDGENEEIENIEDLLGMLYCINGSNYRLSTPRAETNIKANENLASSLISLSVSSEEKSPSQLSDDDYDDDDDDYDITEYDFDSYTIREYCYLSSSSSNSSSSISRELSIFVCDEITYYRSAGQSTSSATYEVSSDDDYTRITKHTSIDFDIEIFIDTEEKEHYIKVNSWYMSAEEPVSFSSEILGKWLDIQDSGLTSALSSVNSSNLSAISTLSSAINQAYREDELRNKSKFQTLTKKDFGDAVSENYDRFNITIDITKAETPSISLITAISGKDANNSSYYANLEAIYTFENIDNTIVSMDKNADIFEIDEDDVDDYIFFD